MIHHIMTDSGHVHGKQRAAAAAALLALPGVLLLVLSGLTLSASLVGSAAASPLLLLFSPVLVLAALLAGLFATGAVVSAALALGALAILSRLARKAASRGSDDGRACACVCVEEGKRRVGELGAVAAERTPHAALAVVGPGQGITDHKKAKHYQHYVAGRMVQDDA